ncbi:TPA: hypothetical protein ACS72K_003076 [Providencia alcalifaciens]
MKNPKLIVKPFAKNGQKNVIPENYETSMDSNQATWDQGFGQITMLPVAAGGLPPKGQDFNGILNQISENIVYQSQGGRFKFSPEYAESIGGYPKGAILQSDDEKKEYQSLIDNNKVNFNTESNISASWELVGDKYAIKNEVDLALMKKFDKENISGALGNDNNKVPSLNLLTTEVGKLQPKGNYQPAGDYATNAALTSGLAGKQPTGDYATNTALANGLSQKLNTSNVVQSTGSSTTQVMSQDATTKAFQVKGDYITKAEIENGTNTSSVTVYKNGSLYPLLRLKRSDGVSVILEAKPDEQQYIAEIYRRSDSGTIDFRISLPKKTGVISLSGESYTKSESLGMMVGYAQKFVDVRTSREKGVTYTNSTGKPIIISVSASLVGSVTGFRTTLTVDGVDFVCLGGGFSSSDSWKGTSITMLIPDKSTYKLESGGFIESWVELR